MKQKGAGAGGLRDEDECAKSLRRLDARILRTRESLRQAILELASKEQISQISVTTIARAAGINRTTFYQHASSPEELLARVLSDELAEIRNIHTPAMIEHRHVLRRKLAIGMAELVDYLLTRKDVFRQNLRSTLPSLHDILASEIEKATLTLFEAGVLENIGGSEVWPIATAYHSNGFAAALLKWLDQDEPAERGKMEAIVQASLPNWFPISVADGNAITRDQEHDA